jgi:tetratricopeptide (TPR) repeat protein
MRRLAFRLAILLLAAALMPLPRAVAAEPALQELLARAAALSAAEKHRDAYALLAAEEDTHIGEIAFDYALGRAALNAGLPDRATLAFSRVLALDPGHVGARIDSGRAFLALGNRAQARATFEDLLALDPPPALRAQLLVYLGQARSTRESSLALRGYLGISVGTSNNVNQAPAQGQVFVPGLLETLQLADQNVRKSDSYASLFGGGEVSLPLQGRASLIGSAEFSQRSNRHESDFNVGGLLGSLGLAWGGERYLLRAQAQAVRGSLGGRTSRDVNALNFDAIDTAASGRADFAFLQLGSIRHAIPELQIFDADFTAFGAGSLFRIAESSTLSVALLAGADKDQGGNPSGDRRVFGIRAQGDIRLSARLRLDGQATLRRSRYDAFDAAFLAERRDNHADYEAFLQYEIAPKLFGRLGASHSIQSSNIPIYEFSRTDWWLMLRRDIN